MKNSIGSNLPNLLTVLRVLLIPWFVYLLLNELVYWALAVFIVAALTDWLDGYLARKNESVSVFGKIMDPIADKILVMAALVVLVSLRSLFNASPWVPAWMVIAILAREIWINGIRSYASAQQIVVAAGNLGKIKSFLQMVGICFLILHDQTIFYLSAGRVTAQFVGERLLLASIIFSIWSAIEYTWLIFKPNRNIGKLD